ncbi:MAG: Gfo/Idh/MocA family oxidoreductase [Bacteroidales bacterium]|nr:MAG: Gfo/Idh/MocA family oxidoreductase [Bacteroidales bacterium]
MGKSDNNSKISRRTFIGNTAKASAAFTVLPGHVISGLGHKAPSDKLNIAFAGIGGKGADLIKQLASENIVALCDVDWKYAGDVLNEHPEARKYKDYRKMMEEAKDIDAVVIATPDHTHAIIAMAAMKMGKHVYCEKPLTHSVYESRLLTETAKKYKVATQMGNQGNSGEGLRQICEWIWSGAIGEVKEAYAWTNRPIWPQGLERPKEQPPVPDTLAWDLFIGPAPYRPYHPTYTPWNWRGWWDFGTGALGDMACHIIDPVFKALKLQYPVSVQGSSTLLNNESPPVAEIVKLRFPARKDLEKVKMPEVSVTWYDGGLLPPRPAELPEGEIMGRDTNGGCLFVGSKGKLMCGCYGRFPILLPYSEMDHFQQPPKILRRVELSHPMDWVRACKESPENRVEASSNFGYSGPLNEMVVMGVVAVRLQDLKRELKWDGENMKFTNISDTDEIRVVTSDKFEVIEGHPHFDTQTTTINAKQAAEEYIKHTYRDGWTL